MPTKKVIPIKQITAWSYSRYSDYSSCPRKAKYKVIDKLKEPGSAAMDRGSAIHALAERYAKKELRALPDELALFKAEFTALRKQKVITEEQWAFTVNWEPAGWSDWNSAWLRVKMDCAYVDRDTNRLQIIDHKTGRVNDAHKNQLSLYAVAGLIMFPDVQGVDAKLWYLDQGEEFTQGYERGELPFLQKTWERTVKKMLTDKTFKPNPGPACRWCHFKKGNGGPCEF